MIFLGLNHEKAADAQEARAAKATAAVSSSIEAETLRILNRHHTYPGHGARTGIMIYNATGSLMKFRLNHDIHGSAKDSFPAIANGKWGLVLHVKKPFSQYGSEGFMVYTARNGAGENCDVNMCFMTPFRGKR